MTKLKLIRITTVPISLEKALQGQLSFMNRYYEVIGISSGKEHLGKIREKEGIRVYNVDMSRKITLIKDLKALIKLYRFIKKEKPFIVHTHTPKAGTLGMITAWMARVPHRLHTIAGLPLLEKTGITRKFLNFVEKITYGCATMVYPNSNGLKEIIIEQRFCSPNKLKVIGKGSSNGIDTTHFDPKLFSLSDREQLREKYNINNNDFVFLFPGRLVTDKGINELVSAFDELCKTYSEVKLLLIGPDEKELDPIHKESIEIIKNNKNIIHLDFQVDIRPFYYISDALVFPSYREGFPNAVMEAGAMSLPSIVSDINGCNEIIKQGINGVIIPVKDKVKLQKEMEMFINSKEFLKIMASNARNEIKGKYERTYIWNELLKEYQSLS